MCSKVQKEFGRGNIKQRYAKCILELVLASTVLGMLQNKAPATTMPAMREGGWDGKEVNKRVGSSDFGQKCKLVCKGLKGQGEWYEVSMKVCGMIKGNRRLCACVEGRACLPRVKMGTAVGGQQEGGQDSTKLARGCVGSRKINMRLCACVDGCAGKLCTECVKTRHCHNPKVERSLNINRYMRNGQKNALISNKNVLHTQNIVYC